MASTPIPCSCQDWKLKEAINLSRKQKAILGCADRFSKLADVGIDIIGGHPSGLQFRGLRCFSSIATL